MEHTKKIISLEGKSILVTGSPGFIGANVVTKLLKNTNCFIVSLDNMNNYYDVGLKRYRLEKINTIDNNLIESRHIFVKGDISDKDFVERLFCQYRFDIVVHLAAQAGVRYSIDYPDKYMQSNVQGFYNILEVCRNHPVEHLIFASSSSVYGNNEESIYMLDEDMNTGTPVSFYAATKKTNEIMAYSYAAIHGIPTTGLRFFTVYGPAGRPDMFYFSATRKLIEGADVLLYNNGEMYRDFTYIDDVVEAIYNVIQKAPAEEIPYSVYNVGTGRSTSNEVMLNILIEELRDVGLVDRTCRKHIKHVDRDPADVLYTCADMTSFIKDFGYIPKTSIVTGLKKFCEWYASK